MSVVSLVSVVSLCKLVQHQGRYAGNASHCRKGLLILHQESADGRWAFCVPEAVIGEGVPLLSRKGERQE